MIVFRRKLLAGKRRSASRWRHWHWRMSQVSVSTFRSRDDLLASGQRSSRRLSCW